MLALAAALAATIFPGCGAALREAAGGMAEEMPGRITEGSLVTLEEQETRDRILALLESPEVQDATRALVAGILDGSIEALGDEARAARIAEASDTFVLAVSRSVGEALDREIGPAAATAVARVLDASLARVTSEDSLERVAAIVRTLAREAVAAMVLALRDDLGPAMRDALRETLEDERTRSALAEGARSLSAAVVLGAQDGLEEIRRRGELVDEPDTLLERVRSIATGGRDLVEIAVVLMALGLVAVSLWLVRSVDQQRRQAAEAQKREAAILAITAALRAGGPPPTQLLDYLTRSLQPPQKASRRPWRPRRPPSGGTPQPT